MSSRDDDDDDLEPNPIVDILCADDVEPTWLVPDFLLQGTLVCLAGEPASGKSYVSYTIGLAVAAGVQALSGIVPPGEPRRVLYFDEENSAQDRDKYLQQSWHGLRAANGGEAPDLGLLIENFRPVHFKLGSEEWVEEARRYVLGWQPHLMVFDTATPAFNIQDENSSGEASKAIKDIRSLMMLTDPIALAMVLKHEKTRADRGKRSMRGSKAWQGSSDAVIFMVKGAGRKRRDGLSITRLEPDKVRAYGLRQTVYITPNWTDVKRTGLVLDASYSAGRDHRKAEDEENREFERTRRR